MNKTDLFNNIKYLYDNKSEERLKHVCDLYLSFFKDLDDYQVRLVKYYSSISKINSNKKSAIISLEDLLRDKKLEDDIKEKVFSSLKCLYETNKEDIPKLIHLLYFGETPFHNYHFRCVNSMLKYMPDYKINIYNTKEPIANEYWNNIKKNKNVEIKPIVVPEFFDDYKLTSFQYKADVVRLELLYEYGGIYLDLDMLIVNNFEEVFNNGKDLYICKETSTENSGLINAFLACKPKNEFLKIWLDNFKTGLRMNIWAYHIRDTNKMLIENNPHYLLKYNIDILGNHTFFPVSWTDTNAFENKNPVLFDSNTYGVHLFETILHHILIRNEFFRMPDEFETGSVLNKDNSVENENIKEEITLTKEEVKIEEVKIEEFKNVDEIVVLTLKERPEKIDYMVEHLTLHNLDHKLIINNLHENPSIGCMESHIGAIKYAKEKGLKSIFIFEDDVLISENFILEEQLKTIPENWDILYFGGILTSAREKSNNWIKGIIWCNHAYIVKDTMYDVILDKYAEINIQEMGKRKETIDHFYTKEILPYYNCWLNENQPIIQKEGYSDLSKKVKWGNNFNWSTFSMKNLGDL
jgi:mannosyltransferase OCH1-like enzyme